MASAHVHAGVAVFVASLALGLPGKATAITPHMEAYHRETAQRLAQLEQVISFDSAQLIMMEVDGEPGAALMVATTIDGVQHVLDLQPHSVRAAEYEVLAQVEDGSFVAIDPGVERTLRGRLAGVPDSLVAASLLEDGLHALVIMSDGDRIWIEPVGPMMPDSQLGLYVVYRTGDVLPIEGSCGVDDALLGREIVAHNHDAIAINGEGGVAGGNCVAQLACDADREYFLDYGTVAATQNRINAVINTVNTQYEAQVALTHQITTIIVRTAEPDPYSSSDSTGLLCQFITEWTNNQTGIQRDVAHLFTGKNLNGGVIGQAADIGDICDNTGCCNCGQFGTDGSYCLAESDFTGTFSCSTDLTAHELGHLWGASHCNCPSNTMNPSITCANNFSSSSINAIISYRNSISCLTGSCGVPGAPANDTCANAIVIGNGVLGYSTLNAGTDGPSNPAGQCNDFGENQTHHDIWYRYQATCSGQLTITTCDDIHGAGEPTYDTDLVLYGPYASQDSISCSSSSLSANRLACNDDDPVNSCGTSAPYSSTIQVNATAGQWYLIRVGGWGAGEQGTGFLSVGCAGTAPEPEPIPFLSIIMTKGTILGGGLPQIATSDNQYLTVQSVQVNNAQRADFIIRLQAPTTTVQEMNVRVELSFTGQPNTKTRIQLRDWANGGWDLLEPQFNTPATDTTKVYLDIAVPSSYIHLTNQNVRLRLFNNRGNTSTPFQVRIDHVEVSVVP
jgi:hypothetical protein